MQSASDFGSIGAENRGFGTQPRVRREFFLSSRGFPELDDRYSPSSRADTDRGWDSDSSRYAEFLEARRRSLLREPQFRRGPHERAEYLRERTKPHRHDGGRVEGR